ncbi:MAG: tRNA-specific adenosine deaminase [Pirellulaceae bacterium]|nr:MAG: tRNA-specific adenosine deaminase [Pirellulaceae bacterium]
MSGEELMRMAIRAALDGIREGQSPFGCAIALGGELLACCHNTVLREGDITAHAEINALRQACRVHGHYLLEGAEVATTCEPCPMCMGALHWARVGRVYYGASIADAAQAGFNELRVAARDLVHLGGSRVALIENVLRQECIELFRAWEKSSARQVY